MNRKNRFETPGEERGLSKEEVIKLLGVEIFSEEYYRILSRANAYARTAFQNKGIIFAQIGVDAAPCSVNCRFCRLASDNYNQTQKQQMTCEEVVKQVESLIAEGADEVFVMSTADIDKELFLEMGAAVRKRMPDTMRMVANTADFDLAYAKKLSGAGFTGVYHICRLGEGVDTEATLENRIITLEAIKEANLELYYCVEPIGPEHSHEQIAEEIFRAKDYGVNVMAVMRRINFAGSPMAEYGEITAAKLALICAVSVLYVRPNRAMGVHEPEILSLISGANQIYAEMGSNPRDLSQKTEQSRGFCVRDAQAMLRDAQWE